MFKHFFVLGVIASIASIVACLVYAKLYAIILVDFSEGLSDIKIITNNLIVGMSACFVAFSLNIIVKKTSISEFIFNLLFSLVAIAFVFVVMNANDPAFTDENATLFAEFYKGYLMPMLFFPLLTWFTFKPLILKK
jgi:Na+/phosphate symporter